LSTDGTNFRDEHCFSKRRRAEGTLNSVKYDLNAVEVGENNSTVSSQYHQLRAYMTVQHVFHITTLERARSCQIENRCSKKLLFNSLAVAISNQAR